ncbi:MAG TPA: glycerol-3-phosphate 1-O-acyltransferase PlsY [Stellaceae bacterium]|nr:glycerol-3-phosphate 1-O-acyltransferase PlsY [Stellaceae bacterium]
MWPVVVVVLAFLVGSVPFGLVFTRLAGLGDIRAIGSGNIGATNVLRTGNKAVAALTLLCDAGKGALAVAVASRLGAETEAVAAFAVVVGHVFPPWLGFNGGKGVATAGGVLLALALPVGLAVGATWLAVAAATRYSSLAAMAAAVLAPLYALLLTGAGLRTAAVLAVALLVLLRHRSNMLRLLRGEESRISLGRRRARPQPGID